MEAKREKTIILYFPLASIPMFSHILGSRALIHIEVGWEDRCFNSKISLFLPLCQGVIPYATECPFDQFRSAPLVLSPPTSCPLQNTGLDCVSVLSSHRKNAGYDISTVLATNAKLVAVWAAVGKVNSVLARLTTTHRPTTVPRPSYSRPTSLRREDHNLFSSLLCYSHPSYPGVDKSYIHTPLTALQIINWDLPYESLPHELATTDFSVFLSMLESFLWVLFLSLLLCFLSDLFWEWCHKAPNNNPRFTWH